MAYGLPDLIEDLDRIVATEKDPRILIGRASEDLRKLVLNRGAIPGQFLKDANPTGTTRNLIHKHPQDRYVVLAILWPPGYLTPVHDHGAWGVSGVYENAIRVTNFVRLDDGLRPDYAELNEPDYRSEVMFPRHIVHKRGGVTLLDLTVERTNTYNPYVVMPVPANVKSAAPQRAGSQ